MEHQNSQHPGRRSLRWPWFALGFLCGVLTFALYAVLVPPRPERYVLTSDVQIHDLYFFAGDHPAPINGVIRKGTEFTLNWRKSVEYFLSFEIPVNGPDFANYCKPLPGTEPFLAPIHENRKPPDHAQSRTAPPSTHTETKSSTPLQ